MLPLGVSKEELQGHHAFTAVICKPKLALTSDLYQCLDAVGDSYKQGEHLLLGKRGIDALHGLRRFKTRNPVCSRNGRQRYQRGSQGPRQ